MAESLAHFLDKEFPPQSMIVGRGILPVKGKMVMGGAAKIGKSYIVINMAINIALGEPLFNAYYDKNKPVFPVYGARSVLYFENEIGEQKLQERLVQILGDRSKNIPLYIKSRDMGLRMDDPAAAARMTDEVKSVKPDVTIIDPLAMFHLSDENSSQQMGAVLRVGDHWIEDHGTSIIYIHHTGHPNPQAPRRGGDKLRGSTAIFAAADSIMLIDRQSGMSVIEPEYRVDFELRHGEAMQPVWIKKLRSGLIQYEGENLVAPLSTGYARQANVPYPGL